MILLILTLLCHIILLIIRIKAKYIIGKKTKDNLILKEIHVKKHYHLKHAFTNLLFSYFIMLVLPTVFILSLYHQAYNMSVKYCVENSLLTLTQMQTIVDERINALDNTVMQNLYNMDIHNLIATTKPTPGDPTLFENITISKNLDSKFGGNPDIYIRYQILSPNNDTIYYNNAISYGINTYFKSIYMEEEYNYELWYNQVFNSKKRILLPSMKMSLNNTVTQAITYNYPIKKGINSPSSLVLQFIVPEEFIFSIPELEKDKGSYFLINGQGSTLCSSNSDITFPETYIANFTDDYGYITTNHDNIKKIIVYSHSKETNMTVAAIYLEEVVLEAAKNIKITALLAIFICFLVELVIVLWMSYRNAIPIHNFAKNLKLLLSDNEHETVENTNKHSEYDYLDHGIHEIKQHQNHLRLVNNEKINLQKKVFYDQLFEGRFKDDKALFTIAQSLSIELVAEEYYVVAFHNKLNKNLLLENLKKLFDDDHTFSYILHDFEQSIIAAIFMFQSNNSTENSQYLVHKIKQCETMFQKLSVPAHIGIGDCTPNPSDLVFSYRQAKYCAKLANPQEPIVIYETIVVKRDTPFYPLEIENRLLNATKFREVDKIHGIFDTLRSENFTKRKLSNPMYSIFISNLESTLFKIYHELLTEERVDEIVNHISKINNPLETIATIESEFLFLASRSEEKRSTRNQQLCDSIQMYLKENYRDSELCLASIADHFNLSDSYFSQFYKDSFNESFSVTLENLRLDHAKQLILEGNVEIEQITKMVGYNNSTTFRRAFKRCTGVSPSIYKSTNKTDS